MNITCPCCGFSRQLPADRVPARAVIATCPQCACRFRFAPGTGVLEVLSESSEAEDAAPHNAPETADGPVPPRDPGEDDPLPPGAIVPGRDVQNMASPRPDENFDSHGTSGHDAGADLNDDSGRRAERDAGRDTRGKGFAEDDGEDPRVGANKAYEYEASRPDREGWEEDDQHADGHNPWESAPEPDGWLPAFYHTCMRVMFGAQRFFEAVRADSPQMRALLFYVIISVIQVVAERVWAGVFLSLMAPGATSDPQLEKMLHMLTPQMSLPMTVLLKVGVSIAQLYILSALVNFTYSFVAGRRTDFPLVFQVMAYSAAPLLLSVVPLLGTLVGFSWSVGCMLVGCRAALKLSWLQTAMGFAPVILLLAPLLLQLFQMAHY